MSLLFPLGLLALGALLVPLLIHLARRTPYTPLDFAALRWLRARQRPRQRPRFDDWPLLLVRLMLLAALALLLARPVVNDVASTDMAWAVVAPGLDARALRGTDTTRHWRWLAPGFPAVEQPHAAHGVPLPSLLRELDARLPAGTALTVYVPDPLPGLDGERLRLSREVQWQPVATPYRAPTDAQRPMRLRLQQGASAEAAHWLAALQQAWSGQPLAPVLAAPALPAPGEIGVWASSAALPAPWQAWLQAGGTVLSASPAPADAQVLLRDDDGAPLLVQQRHGRGRQVHLLGAWDARTRPALQAPELPRVLQLALQGTPVARLGDAQDHLPVRAALPRQAVPPRELAPWLIGLIALLFALERWLASAPQRRRPV